MFTNLWRITVGLNTTCQNSAWTATLLINYVTQNGATTIVPPLEVSVIYNLTLELTTSYDLRLPKHRRAERQIPPPFTLFTLHYFLLRISSIHKIIEVKFHLKINKVVFLSKEYRCYQREQKFFVTYVSPILLIKSLHLHLKLQSNWRVLGPLNSQKFHSCQTCTDEDWGPPLSEGAFWENLWH